MKVVYLDSVRQCVLVVEDEHFLSEDPRERQAISPGAPVTRIPSPAQFAVATNQYSWVTNRFCAGNRVITRGPPLVTTTSSSIRAPE